MGNGSMEKKKKHLSISGGRSVSRRAELAREKSCQVCLMFLMTSRLLICLPLLVFILSFMSDSDWDYWGYVIACSVSYCLHFILNMLVFFFYHQKPIKWSCNVAHFDTHFLYVSSLFLLDIISTLLHLFMSVPSKFLHSIF